MRVLALLVGLALLPAGLAAAPPEKLRVLVDKVISPSTGWRMTEGQVRYIARGGFNVVVPRLGGDDPVQTREVAHWAGAAGIRSMAWLRGTLSASGGCRLVWANGVEQALYSPNADEFWAWLTDKVLAAARVSVEEPALMGVFLDFENYADGKQGNCYELSYDTKIMGEFARAAGVDLPDLPPAERQPWLAKQGLHDRFRQFQIDSWRARCRRLRQQVDAINPRFQFIMYPAPGTLFMLEAAYPEWTTKAAPLIFADACTYGRPGGILLSEQEALAANRRELAENLASVRRRGLPFVYTGGIDPVVEGADPEFSGKNAVMISEITDGYWIFYEGPTWGKMDHAEYWRWFGRANREIAAGRWSLQHAKRLTPDGDMVTKLDAKTDRPQMAVFGAKSYLQTMLEEASGCEVHPLRGTTLPYLRQFDVVVLQNFNRRLPADHPFVRALREYVEGGGGLLLLHDTAWFMASPLPEVATRAVPKQQVEAERHVVDTLLTVAGEHPAAGLAKGTTVTTEFRDHMIFRPGKAGTVLVRNRFGDPVYVAGQVGKGRVVFAGSYWGYAKELGGEERALALGVVRWLGG